MQQCLTLSNMVPGGNIEQYIAHIQQIPLLSDTEERELTNNLYYNDCVESAHKLVMSHLRFVVYTARKFSGYKLPLADLIQEGNVGLMKAVKRFNPTIGIKLASFAVQWIRAEMYEFVIRTVNIVKVATTKAQRRLFFNLRKKRDANGVLSHQAIQELVEEQNVTYDDVIQMDVRLSNSEVFIDDDDSEPLQLEASNSAESLCIDSDNTQLLQSIHSVIDTFDARSKDIIYSRWLIEDERKQTLEQLSDRHNVSKERIRQLEVKAINVIRQSISNQR